MTNDDTQMLAVIPIPIAEFDPEDVTYNFPTKVTVWVERSSDGELHLSAEDEEGAVELEPGSTLAHLILELLEERA